ncbi:hypothetical protein J2TS6_00780 [Paenibacillus albilobatus]|uniref:Uncharacterized protein n=1 Tax=Paenibacillus albilobatus TaxID=2716884 RepID=A0A919XAB2_9BACL|nr:hypothetical protein J2TS6_00780 [Paenibacillus albilobatus]
MLTSEEQIEIGGVNEAVGNSDKNTYGKMDYCSEAKCKAIHIQFINLFYNKLSSC